MRTKKSLRMRVRLSAWGERETLFCSSLAWMNKSISLLAREFCTILGGAGFLIGLKAQ